jgi:hypothetical protein
LARTAVRANSERHPLEPAGKPGQPETRNQTMTDETPKPTNTDNNAKPTPENTAPRERSAGPRWTSGIPDWMPGESLLDFPDKLTLRGLVAMREAVKALDAANPDAARDLLDGMGDVQLVVAAAVSQAETAYAERAAHAESCKSCADRLAAVRAHGEKELASNAAQPAPIDLSMIMPRGTA